MQLFEKEEDVFNPQNDLDERVRMTPIKKAQTNGINTILLFTSDEIDNLFVFAQCPS